MISMSDPNPAATKAHDPYHVFRSGNFRAFLIANILKSAAQQMQGVAIGWEVYDRTKSPMSLGTTGLVAAIPTIGLSLLAGHVADRFSRKWIVFFAWAITAITSTMLAILSHYGDGSNAWLWAVYGTLFINGTAMTFGRPARQAIFPQIIPAEHFSNAVAWNSSANEVCSMIGPAIGALIMIYSLPMTYLVSAIATTFAVWQVARIQLINPPRPVSPDHRDHQPEGMWRSLTAGVRFVFNSKLLLAAMTMDMLGVLLGGVTYVLPMFASLLGVGKLGFGGLRAADAVGACVMALVLAHRPPLKRAGRTLIVAVVGFGAATIVFGLSRSYTLSFIMLAITGACDNISVVIRHSLIQLLPPNSMRGRVSAVNMVFVGSSDQLGGVESGYAAAWLGPVWSVVAGGVGTIVVVIASAFAWPQLWRLGPLLDVPREADPVDADEPPVTVANPV